MIRSAAVVAAVVLLVTGCSGDDDAEVSSSGTSAADGEADDAPAGADSGSPATTAPLTDDADGTANPTTVPTTTAPATVPTTAPTPLVDGVEATIELLAPVSGSGPRPLLEWAAADGAAMYTVAVYAPDGAPYWTWTGPETSVHVGGNPQLADGEPGPSVSDEMSWAVMAFDADMVPVAVSNRRPIAP